MSISRTQVVKFLRKGDKGDTGSRGPTLRGPQMWDDCVNDNSPTYAFQSGAEGEEFIDVVIDGDEYYVCNRSHVGTTSNRPLSNNDDNGIGATTGTTGSLWVKGDKIQLVATKILLATYALVENLGVTALEMKDSAGNVIVEIKDGNVTCKTGTFYNVTISGTVNAKEGKIAGFTIQGPQLINTDKDSGAALIMRDDDSTVLTAVGSNVESGITGQRMLAVFKDHEATVNNKLALSVSARGSTGDNVAINIEGGFVQGFAMHNTIVTGSVTLERWHYNVICCNSAKCTITLPSLQPYDDGHVVRFKRLGDGMVYIKMQHCTTNHGTCVPVLYYDQGAVITSVSQTVTLDAPMDSFELVWVAELPYTSNGQTRYGAWVQYKYPRDW